MKDFYTNPVYSVANQRITDNNTAEQMIGIYMPVDAEYQDMLV